MQKLVFQKSFQKVRYKEIQSTFPERKYTFTHGNLERWFKEENIFLLNCALTVLDSRPGSFMKEWQPFTDDVIKFISETNQTCVFLLLGNFAKQKAKLIQNNFCIFGVHPSPYSAHNGFFGSNIFKTVEERLGHSIDWST